MAVESLCIPSVTDLICEHFDYYAELRLHATCTAVLHSNEVRRRWHHMWWDHLYRRYGSPENIPPEQSIYINEAEKWLRVTEEAVAVHNSIMGGEDEKWHQMPGRSAEEKWEYFIHRPAPHNHYNDPIFSEDWAAASRQRGNPQSSMQ